MHRSGGGSDRAIAGWEERRGENCRASESTLPAKKLDLLMQMPIPKSTITSDAVGTTQTTAPGKYSTT